MNSTGIYFRVKRDGKWDDLLIEDLNGNEILDVLEYKDVPFLRGLIIKLCNHIYDGKAT